MRIAGLFLSLGFLHAADFAVGTAVARPGQKANGFIQVPAGVDAALDIPVIVINGVKPGPTLALLAGAHGTEYASIIALMKLAEASDPAAVSGTVIVVPLLNVASFLQKVPHLNPVDGKNMNRLYPGKPDGTQTERALWAITKQVLEKCDYLIDFHGGDLDENMRRYSYWPDTGNDHLDQTTRGMVLAFGFDHIIIQHNRPTDPRTAGVTTVTRQAQNLGKPAIAVEAGHAGTTHAEDVDALVEGSRQVMRHLKMLPGVAAPVEHPLWIGRYAVVTSDREGVFYPLVVPEAYVKQGSRIGYMTDYFGNKVWDVTAPLSGVVIYIGAVPSMKKGDNIGYIGEIAGNEPQ
ncbi:MAG: M14 family metallopeptidase [Bryobacteraceae bacterium]